jgi:hypothetical protein
MLSIKHNLPELLFLTKQNSKSIKYNSNYFKLNPVNATAATISNRIHQKYALK